MLFSLYSQSQITIDVGLHGVDCVSHYKLFLCDETVNLCQEKPVSKPGNVTFNDLKDGNPYKYQLIGYDDTEAQTFVTEAFDIETLFNVSVKFKVFHIDNTSVTLDFQSSIFDKGGKFSERYFCL